MVDHGSSAKPATVASPAKQHGNAGSNGEKIMGTESLEWLNQNTLIGFTDKRGRAWHSLKGYDNHYPLAIPVEDVQRRLFDWAAEERPLYVENNAATMVPVPGRKAIVRSDTGHVMGIFKDGYQPHQKRQWLIEHVASIINGSLQIGSAGLLRDGAIAWVSIEVPENMITPEGVEFRPSLLARTSFDGSLATTYGRHITNVVCSNTMGVAAGEHGGQQVKVRHSSKSLTRLANVQEALGVVQETADDFAETVHQLAKVKISFKAFERIMDELVPLPDPEKKRAVTLAEAKRDKLWDMWETDERVIPWAGTGFGAWMAYNTYAQHEQHVRGMSRQERNMLNAVNGTIQITDVDTVRRILALAA